MLLGCAGAQSIGGASGISSASSVGGGGAGACGGYLGPGDVKAYYTFWSLRAYKASVCGTKVVHVCNSTGGVDVGCGDLLTSASTGNLVPATIAGITCPGANCTVDRQYDLVGGGNCASPPCDLVQATIALRPTLDANCNGTTLPCVNYAPGTIYLQLAGAQVLAQPLTLVGFASQTSAHAAAIISSGSNDTTIVYSTDGSVQVSCGAAQQPLGTETDGSFEGYVLQCNGGSSTFWYSPLIGALTANVATGVTGLSGQTYVGYNGGIKETEIGVIASAVSAAEATVILANMRGYWQVNGPPVAGFLPTCSWDGLPCPAGIKFRDFSHLAIPAQVLSPGCCAWNVAISNAFFIDPSVQISGTWYGFTENSNNFTIYPSISAWTSSGPNGSWTPIGSNPILSTAGAGWESSDLYSPSVIKIGSTWYLYYCGFSSGTNMQSIGFATSPDLVNWTKYASNPIITGSGTGPCDPSVIDIAGTYYMYLSSNYPTGPILYYTSADGITWTLGAHNSGQALPGPVAGDWDFGAGGFFEPSVTLNKHGYYEMTYLILGPSPNSTVQIMGYAVSNDGFTWYRYGAGPIQSGGVVGYPGNGRIVESSGTLYLFGDNTTIGLAGVQVQTMKDY